MKTRKDQRHLLGTHFDAFAGFCADKSLPGFRARQVYEWAFGKGVGDFEHMTNLGKALRAEMAEHWQIATGSILRRQQARDGTVKLLLAWPDGGTSECVMIPDARRRTACISSQVGCPVQCRFCASGVGGLQRNLTAGEIVEQVIRVREIVEQEDPDANNPPRLSNIVFMGLGEPMANYDNVLAAIRIINADWGLNIGARKITVSTVGVPKMIKRLAGEDLQINLAISLHAPTDELRKKLIPWAKAISIDELTASARDYFNTTGREVTIEYLLLGGVNDTMDHANKLTTIARRMRANVNLIRYNPVPGLPYERPTSTAAHTFLEQMRSRGVTVHVRKSRGLDIDAACGQLRRSNVAKPKKK